MATVVIQLSTSAGLYVLLLALISKIIVILTYSQKRYWEVQRHELTTIKACENRPS
jgi:hypothetical protein